jgi:hypothetical protein
MPDYLRGSHQAAGNWGVYPHNGAVRERVSPEEAKEIVAADPDGYAHIVSGGGYNDHARKKSSTSTPLSHARKKSGTLAATIEERGNGFADVGDYVTGDDGQLYRVVALEGPIHTGSSGGSNYIHGRLEPADWDDVTDETEPTCAAILSHKGSSHARNKSGTYDNSDHARKKQLDREILQIVPSYRWRT